MPKICYDSATRDRVRNSSARMAVIKQANAIIATYRAQGFDLTLRQLYYQFVARALIANNDREYKRLGDIVGEARMAGLIDWESIVDRTRYLRDLAHWGSPAEIVEACAGQFRVDKWANQPYRPEVWIEKDALVGVIQGVCEQLDVPYFSCRGYTSLSEIWSAGRRLMAHVRKGQTPVVLHFGDHDPSGMDMSRDIEARLATFAEGQVEVRRLALNWNQIQQYNPPPNPAKVTDSRAKGYIAQFGNDSWELDALDPNVIAGLIRAEVQGVRDEGQWQEDVKREGKDRWDLSRVAKRWDEVTDWVHHKIMIEGGD